MTMNCSSSHGIEQLQKGCHYEWMSLQAKHIVDLKEALMTQGSSNDHKLEELVGNIVHDFQKYVERRSELSCQSCSSYFAPSWNSSLENGLLWVGGCRPSSFIRVIYAICGSQTETNLSHYLLDIDENADEGNGCDGSMSDLTPTQLDKINELHMKVVGKEDKITKKAAILQDDVMDMPLAVTAYATDSVEAAGLAIAVDDALDKLEESMANLMKEADNLRFETLTNIIEVLTPVQAAEFLLAGKRLNVSLREWGKVRDERHFGCTHSTDAGTGKSKRSVT